MSNSITKVWLQSMVVLTPSPDMSASSLKWASSGSSHMPISPAAESHILRTTLRSVPIIWKAELSQDYKELGESLSEMTKLNEGDEWIIDKPVYQFACHIAFELMLYSYPAPQIFTHGPKSVVFDWSQGANSLYLTISADKISALISTPERIKRRVDYSTKELLNPSLILSAIQSAHLEQPVVSINKAVSDPSELVG